MQNKDFISRRAQHISNLRRKNTSPGHFFSRLAFVFLNTLVAVDVVCYGIHYIFGYLVVQLETFQPDLQNEVQPNLQDPGK
jgi:archaellum biogenesis protein FlaJ (TadC family)